jgi:outer membrane protein OmpA-like peptidoglycan-associated protein
MFIIFIVFAVLEMCMLKKIAQGHVIIVFVVMAFILTGCKKDQTKVVRVERDYAHADMPLAMNNSDMVSVFDDDVEAFVLEEEGLESPYDDSFNNDVRMAYNQPEPTVQDFTFEQLDTKDEMQTVYFSYDSKELGPEQKESLKTAVQKAQELYQAGRTICCKGHSCKWHGTRAYNLALSMNRANVIADHLEHEAKIPRNHIKIFGIGNEDPVALEDTKEGQAPNRRVEIYALAA